MAKACGEDNGGARVTRREDRYSIIPFSIKGATQGALFLGTRLRRLGLGPLRDPGAPVGGFSFRSARWGGAFHLGPGPSTTSPGPSPAIGKRLENISDFFNAT